MKVNADRIKKGMWWDRAWSLVEGCSAVSEGCVHCWSAAQAHIRANQKNEKVRARYHGLTDPHGCWTGMVRLMHRDLDKPRHVKKPTVWAIWNDLFHPHVPNWFVDQALAVISDTPHHTYVLLTKRPENMARYFDDQKRYSARKVADIQESEFGKFDCDMLFPLPNLILGVTAENQQRADERIPVLLQIPAAVRAVSVEPMLGPVDINKWLWADIPGKPRLSQIHWVICGGESGTNARPMHPIWAFVLRCQCQAVGVPFFFKQWGEYAPLGYVSGLDPDHYYPGIRHSHTFIDGTSVFRIGKNKTHRLLMAREWSGFPKI